MKDEQLLSEQLEKDLKDIKELHRCANFQQNEGRLLIQCKLGLWSVEGEDNMTVINEAMRYFYQYKSDGEYSGIIGGKSIVDTLKVLHT